MKQISDSEYLRKALNTARQNGKTIGFVPTMGALHKGHLSLIRKSKQENDLTVVSIFVNPTQFGPREDLKKYPRPLQKDLRLLRKAKVDFVFLPASKAVYPEGFAAALRKVRLDRRLREMGRRLCGKFRPGHFRGVLCVVEKLFRMVRPHRAYFGAKDFQQAAMIRHMNSILNLGIQIRVLPTVREKDGLAMSSRNLYLSRAERIRARSISQVLFWVRREIRKGNRKISVLLRQAVERLGNAVDEIQYFEIAEPKELKPLRSVGSEAVVLTACRVGKTRLIDNVIIRPLGR